MSLVLSGKTPQRMSGYEQILDIGNMFKTSSG